MSTDIVSTVMLSLASRTQQNVQIAVMRRAQAMQADMLRMIDDVTSTAPRPSPAPGGQQLDKRA